MALHLIPDDGREHTLSPACRCGVRAVEHEREDGSVRPALRHTPAADADEAAADQPG